MSYKPKNILVTGGAGFIGCNYIRYVLSTDETVNIVNLDNLSYAGTLKNLEDLPSPERHQFVEGDICDKMLMLTLLRDHKIDTIVHFAAESHVDRSISGPEAFIQSNLVGTFTLLEASREILFPCLPAQVRLLPDSIRAATGWHFQEMVPFHYHTPCFY